jgi:hypothetical protein
MRQLTVNESVVRPKVANGQINVRETNQKFMLDVFSDTHHWIADA